MATAPTIHHLFLLKWWWASPRTFFFLLNRLTIRFHPHQLSIQTIPGVPSGFFVIFFSWLYLHSVSAAKWKRRPFYRPTSISALRHLRNLSNPRSLEFSYGQSQCKYRKQSQCKYRKTTAGNLTKRHTLANVRFPHHIRATSSNRSSSYRPE